MTREQLLATTFVELADTFEDDFDVLDFLQNLVERSTEILHATAAALILADQRGDLGLAASSTHSAQVLELVALAAGEGPCLDAVSAGRAVINVPLDEARRRWPRFTEAAIGLGYASVHVFPLRVHSEVLGALSLFFTDVTEIGSEDASIGSALVAVATIGLLQERSPRQKEILASRLQEALTQRVVIEQAKGVIAERTGLSVDDAFALLAANSRQESRRLGETAAAVLDGRLDPEDLRTSS